MFYFTRVLEFVKFHINLIGHTLNLLLIYEECMSLPKYKHGIFLFYPVFISVPQ